MTVRVGGSDSEGGLVASGRSKVQFRPSAWLNVYAIFSFCFTGLCSTHALFQLKITGFEIVIDPKALSNICGFVCTWSKGSKIDSEGEVEYINKRATRILVV